MQLWFAYNTAAPNKSLNKSNATGIVNASQAMRTTLDGGFVPSPLPCSMKASIKNGRALTHILSTHILSAFFVASGAGSCCRILAPDRRTAQYTGLLSLQVEQLLVPISTLTQLPSTSVVLLVSMTFATKTVASIMAPIPL
jgi:hypothetical protein